MLRPPCGPPAHGPALEEPSPGIRHARVSRLALCFSPASTPSDHGAGARAGGRPARRAGAAYVARGHQDPPAHARRPSRRLRQLRSGWRWRAWLHPRLSLWPCNTRRFYNSGTRR